MPANDHPGPAPRDLGEEALLGAFESRKLDVRGFDHEAHVRVGWSYLRRRPLLEAIGRFNRGLKSLAESYGLNRKYHETISWFYMLVINERMQRSGAASWEAFKEANPDLFVHKGGLVFDYYSEETISSDFARRHFVLPPPRRPARPSTDR